MLMLDEVLVTFREDSGDDVDDVKDEDWGDAVLCGKLKAQVNRIVSRRNRSMII